VISTSIFFCSSPSPTSYYLFFKFPNVMCAQTTGSQTLYMRILLLFLAVSSRIRLTLGGQRLVNYTIDDTYGDLQTLQPVVYTPSTGFAPANCGGCEAQLDANYAFDKSKLILLLFNHKRRVHDRSSLA
jgi:hypothetical protein